MDKLIIDSITLLLAVAGSLTALYKVILDLAKEKTKRIEIEAKENSLGREAVVLLKDEISKLKETGGKNELKLQSLDSAIHTLQFICNMIEGRMLQMFPERKNN